MNTVQVVYVVAGLLLPLYYVPQVQRCLHDNTRLSSYSMGKSGTQLVLRTLMMPFVYGVGDPTMSFIVSLDFAGRAAEYIAAVWSLRRQSESWRSIVERSLPLARRRPRNESASTPSWSAEPAYGHYAVEPVKERNVERHEPSPARHHAPSP